MNACACVGFIRTCFETTPHKHLLLNNVDYVPPPADSEAAPDGALAAAREALETLDAGASTRAAAAAIADPVRADLARSAAAGERAALVDLVGALGG